MKFTSEQLKEWGIVDYGFSRDDVPLSRDHYNEWVRKEEHLPLTYLEGERQEKRQSLKMYWDDFQSAAVFLFSYHEAHQKLFQEYKNEKWNGLKIASYTMGFEGQDYHHLVRERLIAIGEYLKGQYPDLDYKLTLDTHPVLERDLAVRAGLGWFGKNSMLINKKHGSFFIIGSLLLNKDLSTSIATVETDHCGQCNLCAVACPTNAIDPELRTIHAQDCISTFTIEQFKLDSIPGPHITLKEGTIFGCDICQDVCPWNKRIDRQSEKKEGFERPEEKKIIDFFVHQDVQSLKAKLEAMTEGEFRRTFKNTSFERSGRRGLLKNILHYLNIFS